ncbi:MAG: hypothetical protein LBT24_05855, partial [Tannerella sp.]|nr:hypothetical protein [Tannerella sp.]
MKKYFLFAILWAASCSLFAQEKNLLSGKYSVSELQNILIPQAEWRPFPRLADREGWAKADKEMLQACIKAAEASVDYDWPTIPATLSLAFVRDGNR